MNKQLTIKDDSFSKWKTPNFSEPKEIPVEINQEELGYSTGYQAGFDHGSEEIKSQVNILNKYVESLSRAFDDQNQSLAEYLVKLSGNIAKAIVKKELSTEPELILTIVRDTISALNENNSEISIYMNPESAKFLRSLVNDKDNKNEKEGYWKIIEDPLVEPSNCKVSSNFSIIDVNIESRVDLIINQLLDDSRNKELQ